MPDTNVRSTEQGSLLLSVAGRQRVGKTTVANAVIQFCRAYGGQMVVLNADQQNATHSLSTFFPDARVPLTGSLMDNRAWLEGEIIKMVAGRYHVVLDAGGGFTGFSSLAEEVSLGESLAASGVKVVGLVCVGTEQADLDYLSRNLDAGTFRPDMTMIVFNAGLITSGRSAAGAFNAIAQSEPVLAATAAGARVVVMPALGCMSEVTDRGISFADAAEGRVKPGQAPMSLFDPIRVREWWTKKMPQFFAQFPPGWLPMPMGALATELAGGDA